jgi:hypothetical protein
MKTVSPKSISIFVFDFKDLFERESERGRERGRERKPKIVFISRFPANPSPQLFFQLFFAKTGETRGLRYKTFYGRYWCCAVIS